MPQPQVTSYQAIDLVDATMRDARPQNGSGRDFLSKTPYTLAHTVERGSPFAHIFTAYKNEVVIVPRATEGIKDKGDLLADVRFLPNFFGVPWAYSPAGFTGYANKLMEGDDGIVMWLERHARDSVVVVLGHSLGGAAANIIGNKLPTPPAMIWTIGAPRCGSKGMGKRRVIRGTGKVRIYTDGDRVTQVPLALSFPGLAYRHDTRGYKLPSPGLMDHGSSKYRQGMKESNMIDGDEPAIEYAI